MPGTTEPYLSRYLHHKAGQKGIPVMGNFELTPRCNFRCRMCYVHLTEEEARKRGSELSTEEWMEIAEEAKAQGMMFLLLTGGEPLLRHDFIPLYTALKKMGFLISINSNGSLVDGEALDCLRENPPYRMNITLYGGSNESYERLCGVPSFDRVIHNVDALCEAGIMVRLNASLTPYNRGELEKIYQIAEEKKLQIRATAYMNPPIRVNDQMAGTQSNRFSPEDAAKCTVKIDRLRYTQENFCRRAEGLLQGILPPTDEDCEGISGTKMRCRAGKSSFWMTWNGMMLPCGMLTTPAVDVRKVGFTAAWQNVRELTDEIRLPAECTICPHRKICSVCAAMCQSETGFFEKRPEYICRMTQALLYEMQREYEKIVGGISE